MYTLKSITKHNLDYVDSFVDLKVEGWKAFAKATNSYTYGFMSDLIEKQTSYVEKFANAIKDMNKKTLETI